MTSVQEQISDGLRVKLSWLVSISLVMSGLTGCVIKDNLAEEAGTEVPSGGEEPSCDDRDLERCEFGVDPESCECLEAPCPDLECEEGSVIDPEACECVRELVCPDLDCEEGSVFDPERCECVRGGCLDVLCEDGTALNPETCECVRDGCPPSQCEDGFTLDPETCDCVEEERCPDILCERGSTLDPESCECVPSDCLCPEIYQPVCGDDGETYSSACHADCVGAEVLYEGPCPPDTLCFDEGVAPSCEALCSTFNVCINEYCGTDEPIYEDCVYGCRQEPGFVRDMWDRLCPEVTSCDEFVERGIRLFGGDVCNDITGECVEPNPEVMYVAESPEECERIDFSCPRGAEYYYDECGCGCYVPNCDLECDRAPEEPVCGPDGTRYLSECHATCSGTYEYRPCTDECTCPEVYEPQCGLDGVTYSNSCVRECQGVPLLSEGECRGGSYICGELDMSQEPSCDDVCSAVSDCVSDRCGPDELEAVSQACREVCTQIDPYFLCEFGVCEEVGYLINDFSPRYIECLDLQCPEERRGAEYVAYDPLTCSLIGEIECSTGESFNNECGCGCLNSQCPTEDEARYVSYDADVCSRISISCPEGSELFSNDCGCGCSY